MPRSSTDGLVTCVVLPLGDGKISTGEVDPATCSQIHYAEGDTFTVDPEIAAGLKALGYSMEAPAKG